VPGTEASVGAVVAAPPAWGEAPSAAATVSGSSWEPQATSMRRLTAEAAVTANFERRVAPCIVNSL
jgi:hypothetical protein